MRLNDYPIYRVGDRVIVNRNDFPLHMKTGVSPSTIYRVVKRDSTTKGILYTVSEKLGPPYAYFFLRELVKVKD